MLFHDRADAGRRLAERLKHLAGQDVVVLGLPRGGVTVAFEVALALAAPLDVIIVRKLGVPFQPELAMGALGEGGVRVINEGVVRSAGIDSRQLAAVEQRERDELDRRARHLRGDRPRLPLAGRTVVIVDDGIATGATASAACRVARTEGAARVILAVPVGPADSLEQLRADADEVVAVETPYSFFAIGEFYVDFQPTSDAEVVELLDRAAAGGEPVSRTSAAGVGPDPPNGERELTVQAGAVALAGNLALPPGAAAVVLFAHGSGSGRRSPRNRSVAAALNEAGLGTLLFDLLTPAEEPDRAKVFDIPFLARRLGDATTWLRVQPGLGQARLGYFGASTGAAAALWAAAERGEEIAAIVSRGGRPDLAGPRLRAVRAPTLLIVGGRDEGVLDLNRDAYAQLQCPKELEIVSGATHLFEERGAIERVAELARNWFVRYLGEGPDAGADLSGPEPPAR